MEGGEEKEPRLARVRRFGLRFCVRVPNEILSLPGLRSRGLGPYFLLFNLICMEFICSHLVVYIFFFALGITMLACVY